MSPMPGIFDIELVSVLFIRPAIANVWPSRSSTSVSVRRVDSAGMRKPSSVTALAKSSELTSGFTFRWIRSPPSTVGVKFRRTPNSLKMIVTALPPVPLGCTIGYGYSPPARKLASLPLVAIRFGSARLWNRPLFCSARTAAPSCSLALNTKMFRKSLKTRPRPSSKSGPGTAGGWCGRTTDCCCPIRWRRSVAPSSCIALRLTSAKRTRSIPGSTRYPPAASAG